MENISPPTDVMLFDARFREVSRGVLMNRLLSDSSPKFWLVMLTNFKAGGSFCPSQFNAALGKSLSWLFDMERSLRVEEQNNPWWSWIFSISVSNSMRCIAENDRDRV